MTTTTAAALPTVPPETYPFLFRLFLKVLLSELKKKPHTLLWQALEYLQEGKPLPKSAPYLFRFALEVVESQVQKHPGTLFAALVAELRKLAEADAKLRLDPRTYAALQRLDDMAKHAA